MSVSRAALRRFVDGALTVRLATLSPRGTPLLTPLWFARDGDVIYLGTRRGSPHARHMTRNPRVVLLFGDQGGRRTRWALPPDAGSRGAGLSGRGTGRLVPSMRV
jgi:nitroimidazol reductase NimA-like FMN-containing flavoprotein (pyridoxamine 5'-phosphate oxidase superfamily)